jgi:hypothetical protein
VRHADALGRRVHQLHEVGFAAADEFRERNGRIVARLHDHAVHEIVHGDGLVRLDEHARLVRLHAAHGLAWHDGLIHVDLLRLQRIEDEICGHQLRERRRLDAFIGIARCEHLIAGCIDEHPRVRGDIGRRDLRERAGRHEHGGQNESGFGAKGHGRGNRRKRQAGRDKAHRIDRRKKHAATMPIRIGGSAKHGLNRQTVAVGRAFRQDGGARGEKRSFDRRTRKRFSKAGVPKTARSSNWRVARPETA